MYGSTVFLRPPLQVEDEGLIDLVRRQGIDLLLLLGVPSWAIVSRVRRVRFGGSLQTLRIRTV